MGMGSLKRVAALSLLATLAVCGLGALNVGALTVPGTPVTSPVTVQTPTVRVPSTPPPPAPTVTAPAPAPPVQVSPPKPAPVVKKVTQPVTNVVNKTAPRVNETVNNTAPKVTNTVTKTVPKATDTVKRTTDSVTGTVTGGGSTGGGSKGGGSGSSGSGGGSGGGPAGPAGPLDRILGSVTGVVTGTRGTVNAVGGISGTAGAGAGSPVLVRSADGTTFLVAPGGSGPGASGPGGTGMIGGSGSAGGFPGAFGSGASLAAMLAGATPKQLRAVLSHLEGCMPQLPAVDRRVISMRAGLNGAPLTRPQVGQRLGMSRQQVRNTERRALNRLQYAAANTGCAGTLVGPFAVAGIGSLLPMLQFAGPVTVNGGSLALTGGASGPFDQARGLVSRSAEPLFQLGEGGGSGPAWAIILFTVLFSVSIAALTRELRHTF